MDAPPTTGVTSTATPGATGGWEATASAPSWAPRLASRPASSSRKRAEEADNRSLDRERLRERFREATGIDPRIETDHVATESFHAESGSGQKTVTALDVSDHEKSVTRTMTVSHALDLLTANGKRSESDAHESYPLET